MEKKDKVQLIWQVSHTVLTLVVLAAVIVALIKVVNLEKKDTTVASNQEKTQVITLDNGENRYFIPGSTAVPVATPSAIAAASTASATSTTDPRLALKNINSSNQINRFIANSISNAVTGVRQAKTTAKSSSFIETAEAAVSPFPVVYYVDYAVDPSKIMQVNVYTGETAVAVEEVGGYIIDLDFNSHLQVLAYAFKPNNSSDHYSASIKVKNLDTNVSLVVSPKLNDDTRLHWSPDGTLLAYYYQTPATTPERLAAGKVEPSLYLYSYADQKSMKNEILFDDTAAYDFSWLSDNTKVVIGAKSFGRIESATSVHQMLGVDLNTRNGFGRVDGTLNTNSICRSPLEIGKYIFCLSHSNDATIYQTKSDAAIKPAYYGWITMYDTVAKTSVEFNTVLGEYSYQWLVSGDASKLIHSTVTTQNGNTVYKLNFLNTSTKAVVNLNVPTKAFRIVGWNGNEDNVVLWDADNVFWNINIVNNVLTRITL